SAPCISTADCNQFKDTPSVPTNDTGLKALVVDFQNAAVQETRELPPMIPIGVVVDNRGGGSTNNKQEWIAQPADMPTIVEQNRDLDSLNELARTVVSPQGIDGQPSKTFTLPTRQQLTNLLAIDPLASGNRGFPTDRSTTVNRWLSTLDTS